MDSLKFVDLASHKFMPCPITVLCGLCFTEDHPSACVISLLDNRAQDLFIPPGLVSMCLSLDSFALS